MANIEYDPQRQLFHLHNATFSYIIQVIRGYLVKRYCGPALEQFSGTAKLEDFSHAFNIQNDAAPFSLTTLPLEYSTLMGGDYRTPAYAVRNAHGQLIGNLKFHDFQILAGNENFNGTLPTARTPHGQTLIITMHDETDTLAVHLKYTIVGDLPVLLKQVAYRNLSDNTLTITHAASIQLDFDDHAYDLITLTGAHLSEASVTRQPLTPGKKSIASNYGASGPQGVPATILAAPATDDFAGEALGVTLLWSGNFNYTAQVDQFGNSRLVMGLNPELFSWQLKPGKPFVTPEAAVAYTTKGLNDLSHIFHQFFANHVMPVPRRNLIEYNTWESTYFDVSEAKVLAEIPKAEALGVELIVVDDGWFKNRPNDAGQLGDWVPDPVKFPRGLRPVADALHARGLAFGLWVEPEMISENSELYAAHPDWAMQYVGQKPLRSRNQLVLDLSQRIVQDHLIAVLTDLVRTNHIDYLKWDYNRHFSQPGSPVLPPDQQGEVGYRYTRGLYRVLKTLRDTFPKLIIENCSSGGGRLDGGMLAYTDQTWTSDFTDPVYRMKIMNGFSLFFPLKTFVSHFTMSPNLQDSRVTPLRTRALLSLVGVTGIECPPSQLSPAEAAAVKASFAFYKANRAELQNGSLYRLHPSHPNQDQVCWLITDEAKTKAIVLTSAGVIAPISHYQHVLLHYLRPTMSYQINDKKTATGAELNFAGVTLPLAHGDFSATLMTLQAVSHLPQTTTQANGDIAKLPF
ncbi:MULTISPECIES: alpha-galactosidase [Lacticaseibacillus]|uniref:Alpha-galactosidase n=1 Tax=Lacticaseibacillus casei DSM 20011 = JCM 1134 = ATCC 393 TaxID=1423732 RepID=A0AAD1ASF6_LACCA|nr:alpha-galactosidase [Lacticaseibacillus casei]MBI6596875.1 alpha-galactosidase [Lacticaseibacillus casei]MBO1480610.1 alpha-galactosidase [Lacticaseibacillus casei]MBO2415889.1 alpha-galactosidase [Lacticaseibacillus casei]MCK2081055.1 alpha-galactosidase [Lacticaseibacillus casei]MDZ5496267.1 alpha-galactosidase [Lacticaseibacillus casei]